MFGHEPIKEHDCLEDTARLIDAYTSAGETTPPGLRFCGADGAMTPERVLSVLYGHTAGTRRTLLHNAYPAAWTAFRDRTVGAGADRHVLVAMLAWAGRTTAEQARKRIQTNAVIAWTDAADRSPGLEELHRHLAPARRS